MQDYLADQYPGAPRQDEFLRAALQKGACMVLLDGLDEVGDVGDRLIRGQTLRQTVLQQVQRFAEQRCQDEHGNRMVVTSRLEGYHSGNLAGFTEAELSPLQLPDEVEDFLQRWFTAYIHEHDPALSLPAAADQARRQRVEPLMRSIVKSSSIQLLAINPLLLTILAVIYETRNTPLPERRAELYHIVAETLVKNWRRAQTQQDSRIHQEITAGEIYFLMAELAYWLHEHQPGGAIPLEDWRAKVRELLGDLVDEDDLDSYVAEFLHHAREETGLLTERSPGQIGFFHLTLEEYLAAVEMARQGTDQRVQMLKKHWRNTRWQETLLLAAGELQRRGNRDALEAYLNALPNLEADAPDQQGRPAYLAGRALADAGVRSVGRHLHEAVKEALRETAQALHPETKEPDPQGTMPPRMRAAAADILDELGYTHPDLYRFVKVEVGMQNAKSDIPHSAFSIPHSAFHMAAFPVTNAQYARFLEADDFADPQYWRDFPKFDERGQPMEETWGEAGLQWLAEPKDWFGNQREKTEDGVIIPEHWHSPRFGLTRPSAPVVGICWYEANAYCRWLHAHWDELEEARANPELRSSVVGHPSFLIRLPTEAEWAAAAGGNAPAERFPWDTSVIASEAKQSPPGQEIATPPAAARNDILRRANVSESGIGRTTPVWAYPLGRSPAGVWDLGGNVWEWQANYYSGSQKSLALRGGSWDRDRGNARLAARSYYDPSNSLDFIGFRVVVLVSPR